MPIKVVIISFPVDLWATLESSVLLLLLLFIFCLLDLN